jgi:hypothetical protein
MVDRSIQSTLGRYARPRKAPSTVPLAVKGSTHAVLSVLYCCGGLRENSQLFKMCQTIGHHSISWIADWSSSVLAE